MSELNKEIKDGIRKRIALLLERTNMDKTTFAQAVNMSQSAVSSLLGGRYDPKTACKTCFQAVRKAAGIM